MPCSAFLGCTFGKSNLVARIRGKMAFSFFVRGADKRVRLVLKADCGAGLDRAAYQDYLLSTPVRSALRREGPDYDLPEPARKFASQVCAKCGEKTAEFGLRVQDGCLVCRDCYDAYRREGVLTRLPSPAATGGFSFDVRDLWFTRGTCVRNTSERASYYTHSNKERAHRARSGASACVRGRVRAAGEGKGIHDRA